MKLRSKDIAMRSLLIWLAISACGQVEGQRPPPDSSPSADASSCTPEPDAAFCTRLSACDPMTAMDNCGARRTVDCGLCSGTSVCVANQCKAALCSSFAFPTQTMVPAINVDNVQGAMMALSADGTSVLNQRRTCFDPFTALIIDTNGLTSTTINLSANPALAQMRLSDEGTISMTGDGLTVIGVNATQTGFLASSRPARESSTFTAAAPGMFANIAVAAPAIVINPAISADGLGFYYTVRSSPDASINGHYQALRNSTSETFPAGTRLTGDLDAAVFITGVSADRMTLFIQTSTAMLALTRRSVRLPFVNPNAPAMAPALPGFRTRPFGDCTRLLGTCTGGCNNEQTCVFSK